MKYYNNLYRPQVRYYQTNIYQDVNVYVHDHGHCDCYEPPKLTTLQKWTLGLDCANSVLSGIIGGIRDIKGSSASGGSSGAQSSTLSTEQQERALTQNASKAGLELYPDENGRWRVLDSNGNTICANASYSSAMTCISNYRAKQSLPQLSQNESISVKNDPNKQVKVKSNNEIEIDNIKYTRVEDTTTNPPKVIYKNDSGEKFQLTSVNGEKTLVKLENVKNSSSTLSASAPSAIETEREDSIKNANLSDVTFLDSAGATESQKYDVQFNNDKSKITIDGKEYDIKTDEDDPNKEYIEKDGQKFELHKKADGSFTFKMIDESS